MGFQGSKEGRVGQGLRDVVGGDLFRVCGEGGEGEWRKK